MHCQEVKMHIYVFLCVYISQTLCYFITKRLCTMVCDSEEIPVKPYNLNLYMLWASIFFQLFILLFLNQSIRLKKKANMILFGSHRQLKVMQANISYVFFPVDFPFLCEIKNKAVLSGVLPAIFLVEICYMYACDNSYNFYVLVSSYTTF